MQSSHEKLPDTIDNAIQFKIPYPYCNKKYLQEIQSNFSLPTLENKKMKHEDLDLLYLYSNDVFFDNYLDILDQKVFSKKEVPLLQKFQTYFFKTPSPKRVGIVVGNGSIISLLPDIQADDIILLDIQPIIHNFLLYIKKLILNTNGTCFEDTKKIITEEINKYEEKYRLENTSELLVEMTALGEKHFLSSELRFNLCKKALTEKELLPVQINLFDANDMVKFSNLLKKEKIQISFLNLTNVSEYAKNSPFIENLKMLPLSHDCAIVSTILITEHQKFTISNSIQEFEMNSDKTEINSLTI